MKKIIVPLFFIAFNPLLLFCNNNKGFTIQGTIQGLETGTVELVYRNMSDKDTTIKAELNAGRFTLIGQVPEPELARMNIHTSWSYSVSFFVENTEMNFRLVKDAPNKTEITGSPSNLVYRELEGQQRLFFSNARNYDSARQLAIAANNANALLSADSAWNTQLRQWTQSINATIKVQPKNYAALYFIRWLLFHPPPHEIMNALFMGLDPVVRNSIAGKEFVVLFEKYRKISPGQPAPEISGNDTSGNPQKLASLKGQIVLLDFWASYCGSCRQANPQLKALREKYHASGFEILSVSLDYERTSWVKAIQADKLNWPQASDLRGGAAGSAGIYDVQDLPRNWLIDRKGNIMAHDLSIAELSKKLEELLKGERK